MSFFRLYIEKIAEKSLLIILGPSSRNNLLVVAAPLLEIVSKNRFKSTDWSLHKDRTSHVIEFIAPNIKLFKIFIIFPFPIAPASTIFDANVSRIFFKLLLIIEVSPTTSVQFPTNSGLPKIGESVYLISLREHYEALILEVSGSTVLVSIIIVPGEALLRIP